LIDYAFFKPSEKTRQAVLEDIAARAHQSRSRRHRSSQRQQRALVASGAV
jgi:hypothetical protein